VIYQGYLGTHEIIGGIDCEVLGEPDFLIRQGSGYVVRDAKLSRRINVGDHPEIIASLQLYGWLFERTFGAAPVALEVAAGNGAIVPVEYDGAESALRLLADVLAAKEADHEPFSPVGWSKCEPCGYREHCWEPAVARRDVAVLPDVDVGLVAALRERGVSTMSELGEQFDVTRLTSFERPWGQRSAKVGKRSVGILRHVEAWEKSVAIVHGSFEVPEAASYVMFDLEGLPPFEDDLDRIYLWGFQAFGHQPGQYVGVAAGVGPHADQHAWDEFLRSAAEALDVYADVPWVHWGAYERTNLRKYVSRYGDPNKVAARIDANLVDLLSATKSAVALPVPSYGLKVIEQYVGYHRTQDTVGGDWSIAQYIEAVECDDEQKRQQLLDEILTYNQEDLEATWAVFEWVSDHVRAGK
jgi:predicted RecB family nuclease